MKSYVSQVDLNPRFTELESEVLRFWEEYKLLDKCTEKAYSRDFIFFDGPPFANGLPHYGHLLTGYVKDTIGRARTMFGERVERRFGWDCHGLPAEMACEKELGISGKVAIEAYGIDKFNEYCGQSVMKYARQWRKYVKRQGRLVSFENEYKTMDLEYMESLIWAFKNLYDRNLIYRDFRVMPYSWACETPLSNFEIRLDDAYREKTSKTAVVSFKLKEKPKSLAGYKEVRLLAWTTTPWTLPSNLALAVNSDIKYECVTANDICFVAANITAFLSDIEKLYGKPEGNDVINISGSELTGLKYEPLFPYFSNISEAFRVLRGDFVTEENGTGIVHVAPGFGEDDFNLCKEHNIPVVCPVTAGALFTSEVTDFAGIFVFDANDKIIMRLKETGNWIKTDQYVHSYPHCWRTDTPLIYRAMPSWYVSVSKFSSRMVELNEQINWIPGYTKEQFRLWLANATDWSISRNRFFGTPIPVWESDDPRYPRIDVYGSVAELERDFNVKILNLHRPFVDQLVRPNPDDPTGKSMMRRVPEVLDCWFESGAMPFASVRYPFNTAGACGDNGVINADCGKQCPPERLPADFIVEYVAQIRGWFYTLMVLSALLFDRVPFRNVICHGVVLDGDGKKLSKRLNNYVDPHDVMERYSSDAMRFLMLSSPVMSGGSLFIDKECKAIADVVRLHLKPIWNAYAFFILYANVDKASPDIYQPKNTGFDRYIYLKMHDAVRIVRSSLENYKIDAAYRALSDFFDILDNWYIRRNKKRFWKDGDSSGKREAYNTLYTVISTMALAMAPLLPFLAETIHIGLCHSGKFDDINNSVHMRDFPAPALDPTPSDRRLIEDMELTEDVCNSALAVRSKNKIRVRQPLAKLIIVCNHEFDDMFIDIIKDEINVKEIIIENEFRKYCDIKPKINFPALGKRIPHRVKDIIRNSADWSYTEDGRVKFGDDVLLSDEVDVMMIPRLPDSSEVIRNNVAMVVLDLDITRELWDEGVARDAVRSIQTARQGLFEISDRITMYLDIRDADVKNACIKWKDYIMEQTLSVSLDFAPLPDDWVTMRFDIEEKPILMGMRKS